MKTNQLSFFEEDNNKNKPEKLGKTVINYKDTSSILTRTSGFIEMLMISLSILTMVVPLVTLIVMQLSFQEKNKNE
jgi:hypothetical protein